MVYGAVQNKLICFLQEEALGQERPVDEEYVYFKFEPFVLHVMCATLEHATLMVRVGCWWSWVYIYIPVRCLSSRQLLVLVFVILACHVEREQDGWWQVSTVTENGWCG